MNPFMQSLRPLWDRAEYCQVRSSRLKEVALELSTSELKAPNWRGPLFPESDDSKFIDFLGVINAINFCFADPQTGKKFDTEYPIKSGIVYKGSSAMAACMMRALGNGVPILSPEYLARFSQKEAREIFRCHTNPIPMLGSRIAALRNVGATLSGLGESWSFSKIFSDAEYRLFNNGEGIVEKISGHFLSYTDRGRFNGNELLFYKRAQLLPMMYYGRALDSGGKLPLIRDMENFGVITDYAVPNALRSFGILKYHKTLAERIDGGLDLTADSRVEKEIRAVTARIMLELLEALNICREKAGKPKVTMAELDYPIWQAGRNSKFKHHLIYTTAY